MVNRLHLYSGFSFIFGYLDDIQLISLTSVHSADSGYPAEFHLHIKRDNIHTHTQIVQHGDQFGVHYLVQKHFDVIKLVAFQ